MKKTIIIFAMLLCSLVSKAQLQYYNIETYQIDRLFYRILPSRNGVEVVANQDLCVQYPSVVEVPDSVTIDGQTYAVVRIGEGAFESDCGTFTSISLPETIREIGSTAFAGISTEVTLPRSVRRIGWAAFAACVMDTMRIPPEVEYIAEDAFTGDRIGRYVVDPANRYYVVVDSGALCSKDTTLLLAYPGRIADTAYTVPSTVLRIAGSAFYGNRSLRQVNLPEGLCSIGTLAFGARLKRLHIPAAVSHIDGALRDSASARFQLTIDPANCHYRLQDNMLLSHDGDTLIQTLGIPSVLRVPSGVKVIAECAFNKVAERSTVILPEGLTDIEDMAFNNSALKVELPTTLRTIGDYAFANTTQMETISIPSVRTIGSYAFLYSTLKTVGNATSLRKVGGHAFDASSLRNMHFGDSIEIIGEWAFSGTRLSGDITFHSHLKGIGMSALVTSGLDRVTFLQTPDTIGHHSARCRIVRFASPEVPSSYGEPFWKSDTVYAPCGSSNEFSRAINHSANTVFADWCDEAIAPGEAHSWLKPYPNPCRGILTLGGLIDSQATAIVRDLTGREVLRRQVSAAQPALDLGALPAGHYFVTVATPQATATRKLVIK
ncbi:MAG: leucine-rich repeat domain-containing protein [Bacteroidales bacterium]|nr:leucine-rich repeat domain-containing protein [Bacteroidales bacterium]